MQDLYSLYKPFRNQLRKYELVDSLQVIWGFSRNLTFDLEVPGDIELPRTFYYSADVHSRRFSSLPEFEMEFLMKEMILHCSQFKQKNSLKTNKNLAKLVNYLRGTLDEKITQRYLHDSVLIEFNRVAHRQFTWQIEYHTSTILRYYKLYTHKDLVTIFEDALGLPPYELSLIGISFFYLTGKNFAIERYWHSNVSGISDEMLKKFLSMFSISIGKLRELIEEKQQINENLFYTYNPMLATPLVVIDNYVTCPMPLLVYWKVTGGLYYSLVGKNGFEQGFGNAFQDYVGEVIRAANTSNKLIVLAEEKYGKPEKHTTDWVISDSDAVMFLECKTKRMTFLSKTTLLVDAQKGLLDDIAIMANFILQTYKTFLEFKSDNYPTIKYDEKKSFYPCVVTLEEWFLVINPELRKMLEIKVIEKLTEENINPNIIQVYPYYIFSADQFEMHIQVIDDIGIEDFFRQLNSNKIKAEYKNLFAGEFKKIFLEPLGL